MKLNNSARGDMLLDFNPNKEGVSRPRRNPTGSENTIKIKKTIPPLIKETNNNYNLDVESTIIFNSMPPNSQGLDKPNSNFITQLKHSNSKLLPTSTPFYPPQIENSDSWLCKDSTSLPTSKNLKILTWNCCSLQNLEKISHIMTYGSDIICLQEIWHHADMLKFFNSGVCRTRTNESGGGVMTTFNNTLHLEKSWEVAQDSLMLKVIFKNHIPIFLINIYRSPCDPLRSILNALFGLLPQYLFPHIIAIGDWNVNLNSNNPDKISLLKIIKALKLQIFLPQGPTRKGSTLDFLICGSMFNLITTENFDSPSDHKVVSYHLAIKSAEKIQLPIIPNSFLGKNLTIRCLTSSNNAWEFLNYYNLGLSLNAFRSKITPKKRVFINELSSLIINSDLDTNLLTNQYWRYINFRIETLRYSTNSKQAFSSLKSIYKYHLRRREGDFVKSIQLEDRIINNKNEIDSILAQELSKIQIHHKSLPKYSFPRLPEIDEKELETSLKSISTKKAVT